MHFVGKQKVTQKLRGIHSLPAARINVLRNFTDDLYNFFVVVELYALLAVITKDQGLSRIDPTRIGLETSGRSEEHTSELQSRPHLVCRLLLEKKNNNRSSGT